MDLGKCDACAADAEFLWRDEIPWGTDADGYERFEPGALHRACADHRPEREAA